MEQLVNAGVSSVLHPGQRDLLGPEEKALITSMAEESFGRFVALREHPVFTAYLENLSPLKLLSGMNISSRPNQT